jgi:hypothetical protein
MDHSLPVMERWICRACQPGGCFLASGSSSLASATHEALGMRVPAEFDHRSRRRYPTHLRPLKYPRGWPSRQVTQSGYIRWRGRLRVIGRVFGDYRVGFKSLSPDTHEVYFGSHLVGLLVDADPGGIRPVARKNGELAGVILGLCPHRHFH